MLAKLPVEIILLICEYPEFKELGQLAWTNKRMMGIIQKYLPIVLEITFERKTLFYLPYKNDGIWEDRICLFDSHSYSVKQIAKFTKYLEPYEVATTKDKIFAIGSYNKSFEIFALNTRQITKGPGPPEWDERASVAYFKGKLYYLGGWANCVDVLIDGKWQTGPAFPLSTKYAQTITCDERLYVVDGYESRKIYRLSDDEREWVEVGEIPEGRNSFGVASLNGRIYITGGEKYREELKSCLCLDPSAPANSRISPIADMNYARYLHSLIVANEKLYAIGGFQNIEKGSDGFCYAINFCDAIEEYDPRTNEWREVGNIDLE